MRKLLSIAVGLLLVVGSVSPADAKVKTTRKAASVTGVTSSEAPDFAYPETVAKNAEKELKKAMKSNDGPEIVRSLMDLALAQGAVSDEKYAESLKKIVEMRSHADSPVVKSMLDLLLARALNDTYINGRYRYDGRKLPLRPFGENYNEWSGEQFRDTITTLIDKALADGARLQTVKLQEYGNVVTHGKWTYIYYPTLYDFVASQAIGILDGFGERRVFPIVLWRNALEFSSMSFRNYPDATRRILDIYASLLKFHRDDTAAFLNAEIGRVKYITSGSFNVENRERAVTLLRNLYDKYRDSEYSGEILIAANGYIDEDNAEGRRWLYAGCVSNIDRFQAFPAINSLKNIKASLANPRLDISVPGCFAPGVTVNLKGRMTNMVSGTVKVYRIEGKRQFDSYISHSSLAGLKPVKTLTLEGQDGTIPYTSSVEKEFTLDSPGVYVFVPTSTGTSSDNDGGFQTVYCTKLARMSVKSDKSDIWVIDPADGRPVAGADLLRIDRDNVVKKIGVSSDTHPFVIDAGNSFNIVARKDGSVTPKTYVWNNIAENDKDWNRHGQLFTDLALYHPGDTVRWSGVLYETRNKERRLVSEGEYKVLLYDANGSKIDEMTCELGTYGRVEGRFVLPTDGLTGYFSLRLRGNDTKNNYDICTWRFTVSDYKLPTYRLELGRPLIGMPAHDDVTLSGKAVTYSGFPLADAEISVTLSAEPRFWFYGGASESFYTTKAVTEADGSFKIVLDKEVFAMSPIVNGRYTASVTSVSTAGESHEESVSFMLSEAYRIMPEIASCIEISSSPVTLPVKVVDSRMKEVNQTVYYSLRQKDETVLSGEMPADDKLDFSSIGSGRYSLTFSLKDSTLAMPETVSVVLYRDNDKYSPVDARFWTPVSTVKAEKGRKAVVRYATTAPESYILMTVWNEDSVYSSRWLKAKKGMHTVDVEIPAGLRKCSVRFSGVVDYEIFSNTVGLVSSEPEPGIGIEVESFRDKIVPTKGETWKFRVKDTKGQGAQAAVMLDMYNAALDALKPFSFTFNPWLGSSRDVTFGMPQCFRPVSMAWGGYVENMYVKEIVTPEFDTYGRRFGQGQLRIRGYGMMYKSSAARSVTGGVSNDDVVEEVMDMAAPVAANLQGKVAGVVREHKEEVAVTEAETDGGSTVAGKEPEMAYRDGETALAFFRPMLTTEADGRLVFSFNAPNANTTWRFNMIAYNDKLQTASHVADVIASKPVMVQPNLPRFLRAGDEAVIRASVMNNVDSTVSVATRVEAFDVSTGKVIAFREQTDELQPMSSAVISVTVKTPTDVAMLGFRARSTAGDYTDGEQDMIAVLPASQPVIDTYPFYIAPDSTYFKTTVAAHPADARVTLQFCENPAWEVVSALPGLLTDKAVSSPDAAAAIFSAAVAEGIIKNNPKIATELHRWLTSERSDSMLVSMLERNSDLKMMLLNATPWVMDARSDTERMTRIALLFDRKEIKRVYDTNIALLAKLRCPDGGWKWVAQCDESSMWATQNVLSLLGRLKQLGFMPSNSRLNDMLSGAVNYLDAETAKEYKKYPKSDYSDYVYVRDYFKDIRQSTAASRVTSTTIQRLLSDWKSMGVADKSRAALMLNNHGYNATARQLLESLRQYAEYKPQKGMWWPSLDNEVWSRYSRQQATSFALNAFATVAPGCPEVDRIRQWLIFEKEVQNWGGSVSTSDVIASILTTSGRFIETAKGVTVTIGDKTIETDPFEKATGSFRTDISEIATPGTTLTVVKPGDSPSWGAVICQYVGDMSDIKASSCDAVSIEKKVYLLEPEGNGVNAVDASSYKVGQKVKVELLIHVTREMDYVAIVDERPACFEPVEQLPRPIYSEGICFYRENRDAATNIFVTRLPVGTYRLNYEMWVNNGGEYASGVATLQSQYAPAISAHSSGGTVSVKE